MILDVLSIVLPSIGLLLGLISLVISIKKDQRIVVLKDLTIIMLFLTLITITIK